MAKEYNEAGDTTTTSLLRPSFLAGLLFDPANAIRRLTEPPKPTLSMAIGTYVERLVADILQGEQAVPFRKCERQVRLSGTIGGVPLNGTADLVAETARGKAIVEIKTTWVRNAAADVKRLQAAALQASIYAVMADADAAFVTSLYMTVPVIRLVEVIPEGLDWLHEYVHQVAEVFDGRPIAEIAADPLATGALEIACAQVREALAKLVFIERASIRGTTEGETE